MAHYEYGNRKGSDVVVSLVASGFPLGEAEGESDSVIIRKRKCEITDLDEGEEVRSLEDLYLHSNRLRTYSKYFDAYFSEEKSEPRRLTLDVHTDVRYYKDCFARMYSPWRVIPSVKYCLKLLQVASQISYEELVEACVRYLAAVSWSESDEKRIRNFAGSPYYPSDCAAELSARLGFSMSSTERYNEAFGQMQVALQKYLRYAITDYCDEDYRSLFSIVFRRVTEGQCHRELLQGLLKSVKDEVESNIRNTDEKDAERCNYLLIDIHWILNFLLKTGFAREFVEFMVERSTLVDLVGRMETDPDVRMRWLKAIVRTLEEVTAGRLLLKASTRLELFRKWTGVLRLECIEGGDLGQKIQAIISTFIMTFPIDQQQELVSSWDHMAEDGFDLDADGQFHGNWVANWKKKLISLESQQVTAHRAGENAGQS